MSEQNPIHDSASGHGPHAGRGHEQTDADVRKVAMFGVGLAAMILVACLAMWITFRYLSAHQPLTGPPPSPLATTRRLPPEPRLQTAETRDLGAVREGEDKALASYGWVDKDGGVARIPIERAMDLILQRGIPGGVNEAAKAQKSKPAGASTEKH
jgi:hypothetical protein